MNRVVFVEANQPWTPNQESQKSLQNEKGTRCFSTRNAKHEAAVHWVLLCPLHITPRHMEMNCTQRGIDASPTEFLEAHTQSNFTGNPADSSPQRDDRAAGTWRQGRLMTDPWLHHWLLSSSCQWEILRVTGLSDSDTQQCGVTDPLSPHWVADGPLSGSLSLSVAPHTLTQKKDAHLQRVRETCSVAFKEAPKYI